MSFPEIDREQLCATPPTIVSSFGFEMFIDFPTDEIDQLADEIDMRWIAFDSCMTLSGIPQMSSVVDVKITVLDINGWDCSFHGSCKGELYNCSNGVDSIIILTADLEFLEHEWAHRRNNWDEGTVLDFSPRCGISG